MYFYIVERTAEMILIQVSIMCYTVYRNTGYLLWSSEEQIKVPKLETNPLSRLSQKLIGANESLRISSRICR